MARSPHSGAEQARARIAALLRDLRLDAGITGDELSRRCGWSAAKSSRLEHAKTSPSDSDIRTWCGACGASDQADELVLANRQADQLYSEWRQQQRSGLRRIQESVLPLHERTRVQRVYCSNVVPGFFQTPAYTRALFASFVRFEGIPDDIDLAVESRQKRGRLLIEGDHRFVVLMEETVLRYRIGGRRVMAEQLERLLAVSSLPSVALGIIPFTADRDAMWPLEAFYLYDTEKVLVETLSAELNVTSLREIELYHRAFLELGQIAVYGHAARERIRQAVDALL
ncbi:MULTISPECIES: helix-turn-helix transcriptional regulator [Streptacidiphilus]|uniref:Helix-turn-helix domain-containing protein n=1 Tax=Streptacidiphilus cavernicola TaxID=3342716 RepID=A0ABV6UXE6_9ACTN|nr:helix-turn-helix transcriptional regulator [Streptacidiphilus jeojiense]